MLWKSFAEFLNVFQFLSNWEQFQEKEFFRSKEVMMRTTLCVLQEKQEIIKELNKELRQSNLQHFIHQAGGTPLSEQKNPLHLKDVYLKSSSMMEEKL